MAESGPNRWSYDEFDDLSPYVGKPLESAPAKAKVDLFDDASYFVSPVAYGVPATERALTLPLGRVLDTLVNTADTTIK